MTLRLVLLLTMITPTSASAGGAGAVQDAIGAGRCRDAIAQASRALDEGGDHTLWRLLGDAHRCLGETQPAALAYGEYLAAEGADPTVEALLRGLRERLGRLIVTVQAERGEATLVAAELPDGRAHPGTREGPATWVIDDLDPGTRPYIVVAGMGLQTTRVRAPAAPMGGQAAVEVRAPWIGLATVELSHPPPAGGHVELVSGSGASPIPEAAPFETTAGAATLAIVSPRGRVEVPIQLEAGQALRMDPTEWTPTTARVRGVPAGSSLRLFLEQVDPPLERRVDTPTGLGEVDPEWGVRVAPVLAIDSLVGGPGTLVVSHPALGVVAMELLLEPDADNAVEVDWRSMAEAGAVCTDYSAWMNRRDEYRQKAMAPVIVGLIAGGGGTLASIIGWSAAGDRQLAIQEAQSQALAGTAHADGATG